MLILVINNIFFPIAEKCVRFYRKHEPEKTDGAPVARPGVARAGCHDLTDHREVNVIDLTNRFVRMVKFPLLISLKISI